MPGRRSRARIRGRRALIGALSRAHLVVHRASRGRLLGRVAGMPVLLLTTTGRRSGRKRTTPLTFFRDGDVLVVVGSNGGAARAPDWALNLVADPRATVEIGTSRIAVRGRTATEEERERLWPSIVATFAGYARYQERTSRRIPLFVLSPVR